MVLINYKTATTDATKLINIKFTLITSVMTLTFLFKTLFVST
jgi:hypothetical protein